MIDKKIINGHKLGLISYKTQHTQTNYGLWDYITNYKWFLLKIIFSLVVLI